MKETSSENPSPNEAAPTIETLEHSLKFLPHSRTTWQFASSNRMRFSIATPSCGNWKNQGSTLFPRNTKALTENFVMGGMYSSENMPARGCRSHERHLLSGPSEIVLVKGDIKKLLITVGIKTNPALCDEASIRYMYGDHVPEELGQGLQYYRNAAHRPRDKKEAEKDLNAFREIL